MREARILKDHFTFNELLDLEINRTELDSMQNFCEVLGKSFAVTGCVSFDGLYNSIQLQQLREKTKIPYDVIIKCIHDNQNYHYMMNKINYYT